MAKKHIVRLSAILAAALLLNVIPAVSPSARAADREMRGVWIATVYSIDFPRTGTIDSQQKELRDILDKVQNVGLNAVFFQVRPTGDAYYQSSIFPWAKSLTGVAGKFFDVFYQVYTPSIGWSGLAKNGERCGTAGGGLPFTTITVKLVHKGSEVESFCSDKTAYRYIVFGFPESEVSSECEEFFEFFKDMTIRAPCL